MVGDWNGDGRTKVGYYYKGFWALDYNGNGIYEGPNGGDRFYALGGNGTGEIPVVGDWNGDHKTKIGYYYNGVWALDYNGDGLFTAADKYYPSFSYIAGDKPIVGDWSGSGMVKIGVYRSGFWVLDYNGNGTYDGVGPGGDKFYAFGGNPSEIPLAADWNGDGKTKVGYYNQGFWVLDFNGDGVYSGIGPGNDRFIALGGTPGNQPIVGRW